MFPPNSLLHDAEHVLALVDHHTDQATIDSLIRRGHVGGVGTALPESTWYAFIRNFLFGETEIIDLDFRRTVFQIIAMHHPSEAWELLKAFLIEEIDLASGWDRSRHREDPLLGRISRLDDGTYWLTEDDDPAIRIYGAQTLPETRQQFITDEALRRHGRLRRVLNLFSVFAIASDFAQSPTKYPRSLRLIAWTPEWGPAVPPTWHLGQPFKTRTIHWRPDNNLCDPDWLAGDLLGRVTDSIDRDIWAEINAAYQQSSDPLEPDLPFQWDFVLDTDLIIGESPEALLEFEGRRFRWINHTPESKVVLSVRGRGPANERQEIELVNRFLSALVWQNNTPIVRSFGVGGPKRLTPSVSGVRLQTGLRVSPEYALSRVPIATDRKVLALALHKEARNSQSVFNQFFNYWKILELGLPRWRDAETWINTTVAAMSNGNEWLNRISGNPAEYLRDSGRHAIAHVLKKPIVDPDSYEDQVRLERDVRIVRDLARSLINSGQFD